MNEFRVWVGREGGSDRIIFLTNGPLRFYFSTRWFGCRLRVWSARPYVWVGKA
jgi:hypothetical protein